MTAPPPTRVRALSIHADYRCRNSGACCRSGWEIPVEPDAETRIREGLRDGRLRADSDWERGADGLAHGARVVLRVLPSGDCVFLEHGEPRLCAVHRQLGEDAMPPSCRQFPRVATLTPLGVSVTLSHYCPTAASLLFREDVGLAVVDGPGAFSPSWPYEGLDAREALPPLLRPGVFMDWPSFELWERCAVSALADDRHTPEDAIDLVAEAAERARAWRPERGPFGRFLECVLEPPPQRPADTASIIEAAEAWRLVTDCIPHPGRVASLPEDLAERDAKWVAPSWRGLGRPVRHWLAAKAFASWVALQGEGLRTTALALRVALGLLRAEAAVACAKAGAALDAALLKEAVRAADLRLVHFADPERLARRLSGCESTTEMRIGRA